MQWSLFLVLMPVERFRSVRAVQATAAMMAVTSARLAGIILLLIPLVLVPVLVYGRRVRRMTRDTQDRIAEASGIAGETLNAIQKGFKSDQAPMVVMLPIIKL